MRRANVARTDADSFFDRVAQVSKVSQGLEEGSELHVLEEDGSGSHVGDDSGDDRPDVSVVGLALALSGEGEGLAREARNDEIHDSTPRATVEGSKVRPDWGIVESAITNGTHDTRGSESLPFHVADSPGVSTTCDGEAEVDTAES